MADNVLESFFLSLGWKVDEDSRRKVTDNIKAIEKVATGLSLTFASVAAGVSAALVKMVGGFDDLYFASKRTGATVQGIKGLQYAFEQLGGTSEQASGAIESFSQSLRNNPGLKKFIEDLGVATTEGGKARETTQVLTEAIDAIQKKNPHYVGAQYAALLGVDEKTYTLMSRAIAQLKEYKAESDSLAEAAGLDPDAAAEASADIARSFTTLGTAAKYLGQRLLIELAPAVREMTTALVKWIKDHPDEIKNFFDGVSGAIKAFTTSVTSGDFAQKIDDMALKLKKFADALKAIYDVLVKLGLVGGGGGDSVLGRIATHIFGSKEDVTNQIERDLEAQQKAERPGLFQRGYNWLRRKTGLGGGDAGETPQDAPGGSTASIAGKTFRDKAPGVMRRLMDDFGLSKEEAAVVLGNLGHESAGFTAFEEGGNGPGRGWAQWTDPGRKRRFFEYARQRGLDPKSDEANYGFLRWELQNTHKSSIDALKNGRTTEEKMYAFEDKFEGARVKAYGSRNKYMRDALKAFDDAANRPAPPASVAPPALKAPNPPAPPFRPGMTRDQFDAVFSAQSPMGSASSFTTTNDNRSISIKNDVNLSGGDGRSDVQQWERAMGRYSTGALRDAQTAIR